MVKKIGFMVLLIAAVSLMGGIAMAADEVSAPAMTEAAPAAAPTVVGNKVCPVSGMAIADSDMGKNTVEFEGKVYNLCMTGCKDEFMKDPAKAVAKVNEEMAKTKEAAPVAETASPMVSK